MKRIVKKAARKRVSVKRKSVRKYINKRIKGKDKDLINYLYDLLCKDEIRMVGSKEALQGYYDIDINNNRLLQEELLKYADISK